MPIEPFWTAIFLPIRSLKLVMEVCASTIQRPSQPLASTCMGKPLVATCMVADKPPLPISTSPEATACMRCTSDGNITSSRSMPSGLRRAGIRKAALVVVVKAEPIFTLRRFCPRAARETMAGAPSGVGGFGRNLGRPRGRYLQGGWRPLSRPPLRGLCRRPAGTDRARPAPAALPDARLQSPERRHRTLVQAGDRGDRQRLLDAHH